jgi:hypothetical protein
MAKQTINIGSSANDGQGDPLRTAMDKINDNFDEIYTAGPVSSNIRIANSTITTTNTNGNLLLRGNGTGKIDVGAVGNLKITGGANGYVLTTDGTGNVAFNDVGNITFANLLATSGNITQDLVVGGNLTVNGTTTTINTATLDVEDKLVTIAFGSANSAVADGAGISIAGANANITYANATNSFNLNKNVIVSGNILPSANVTYSLGNVTNQWKDLYVSNNTIYINNVPLSVTTGNVLTIGGQPLLSNGSGATISTTGNVSGGYILGNGSQLTGIVSSYGNANVVANLVALGSNPISTTGNVTAGYILGNGSQLTGITSYSNSNVTTLLAAYGNNTISTTGNITGGYILGNGRQLTGLSTSSISNGTSNVNIATANGNVAITANSSTTWTFGTNGTTRFPDGTILAPAGQNITMQSDQNSQLVYQNANIAVAPNVPTSTTFSVQPNFATLVVGYRDGNSEEQDNTWLWNIDGMTLPEGGTITEGGGISGAIRLTPAGGANPNQALLIYPTAGGEGDHVHLTAGGGTTELYLGNDDHYVKLINGGNVQIQAATANLSATAAWTFNTAGDIDANQVLSIKVPNGVPSSVAAITSTTGSWESNPRSNLATTGGTGSGLRVNVTETGGYASAITIHTAGTGYTNGDAITVTSGSSNATFTIGIAGRNSWIFSNAGNLTAPGNVSATSNIAGGNILTAGLVSATGNITGNYILGNGSQLTGLPATYGNANVVANLAALGSNPVSTTGNVTGAYILGNGSQLTGIAASYGNANVVANLAALGSNPISTTGNVTGGNILTGGLISATGNVTGGNLITAGVLSVTGNANIGNIGTTNIIGTSANVTITANAYVSTFDNTGNVTFANGTVSLTTLSATGNVTGAYILGNGSQLTGIAASYGNANVATFLAAYGSNTVSTTGNITTGNVLTGGIVSATGNITGGNIRTAGQVSATGNITTAGNFVGNGSALTNVTVSVAGNIMGTQSNVTVVAGSYNWAFDNTGNLTLPGNTFAVNYANNTPVNVVTRFESSWTVPVGNSTQSFTVGANETYYLWVDCNIPNGILVWNATATVTNTNVPVVGAQYAWVYSGGGTPIDFTSIPNQFTGTANAIVRSNVAPSSTTNRFDFGLNNTSGGNVTVRYGWIAIS